MAAATTHSRALTTRPDDVFWCAAEIAWIGGQSHGVYGPLAAGATTVMTEGTLDVPARSRAWEIIERYGVNALVTTPSVVRNLRQWVDTPPARADLSSLRLIVTLGERIDPETRNWLDFEVGGGRALIANAWGQTELAGLVAVTATPSDAAGIPASPGGSRRRCRGDTPVPRGRCQTPGSTCSTPTAGRCQRATPGSSCCSTPGRARSWTPREARHPPTAGGPRTRAPTPPVTRLAGKPMDA